MFNVNCNVDSLRNKVILSYELEKPLDPLMINAISTMIKHKTDVSHALQLEGITSEINLFITKIFEKIFANLPDRSYNSEELLRMYKSKKFIEYNEVNYDVDNVHLSAWEDSLTLFKDKFYTEEEFESKIRQDLLRSEPFAKNIDVDWNSVGSGEVTLDFNVDFDLTKPMECLNITIEEPIDVIIDSISGAIGEEQYAFDGAILKTSNFSGARLLTKWEYNNLIKAKINHKALRLGNIISIIPSFNSFKVNEAFVSSTNVYIYQPRSVEFKNIAKEDNLKNILWNLLDNLDEIIIGNLSFELLTSILSVNNSEDVLLLNKLISKTPKLYEIKFFKQLLSLEGVLELEINIPVSAFMTLFENLNASQRITLTKIVDPKVISSIDNVKILKRISNDNPLIISEHQKQLIEEHNKNLMNKLEEYQLIIGKITSSGLREGSKKLKGEDRKVIGYSKNIDKWLNDNIGHSSGKTIDPETIDKQRMDKANEILEVAIKYIQLVGADNEQK